MWNKYFSYKLFTLVFCVLITCKLTYGQNVGINSTGNAPDASAGLDVNFTNKGLLIPRIALTATNAASPVTSPLTSLLVYNTATAGSAPNNVVPGYYYWNGTAWVQLSTTANGWIPSGTDLYYTTGDVGIGTSTPAASAALEVNSSSKGLLIPQVALTATNAAGPVTLPATGLLVYNTATAGTNPNNVTPGFYYWASTWTRLASGGTLTNQWTTATNDIYTNTSGNVGIGSSTFNGTNPEKLLVSIGGSSGTPAATTRFNAINAKGFINNYLQLNVQNQYAGTAASSDVVATADDGSESNYYVDMGINSSANTAGYFGAAHDAYLYNLGEDFLIGTGTAAKSLRFLTGGSSESTNQRMIINGTGNVGIGIASASTPAYRLQINAASNPLALNGVQQGATTDSIMTIATGVLRKIDPNAATSSIWGLGGNAVTSAQNIGTTTNFDLPFIVNGVEEMRIKASNGFVGINNNNPSQALDVTGNLRFSGAIMPGNDPGSANEVLVSQGAGNAPTWLDPNGVLNGISWLLTGNANGSEQKIGTINNFDLPFYTNNVERMRITTNGNFKIGTATTAFNGTNPEKFLVDAGTTTSTNAMNAKGTINNYLQLNLQNQSAGTAASSDIVATNNVAGDGVYIDMGINSSGNTSTGILGGASVAYLHSTGEDFAIGNSSSNKVLKFFTTPNLSTTQIERMRIAPSGEVGIGTGATITSGVKFEVNGAAMIQGIATTQGVLPKTTNTYDLGSSSLRWATIYSQNALNTSDKRLKTNIQNSIYGLKEVMNLKPVTYNWIETPDTNKQIGLIAQDVRKLLPEVVKGDEAKESLAMNYNALIPVLINAIQEQQKQIDDLKKQVETLKNK